MMDRVKQLSAAAVVLAVALACLPGGVTYAATGAAPKEHSDPVDINSASASDLEKVPGIGPSLSKRIIEFREKNGPYSSVEDLLKIQGIGEKSLGHFRDYLTALKPQKK